MLGINEPYQGKNVTVKNSYESNPYLGQRPKRLIREISLNPEAKDIPAVANGYTGFRAVFEATNKLTDKQVLKELWATRANGITNLLYDKSDHITCLRLKTFKKECFMELRKIKVDRLRESLKAFIEGGPLPKFMRHLIK